ncbi:hypothetical protein GCM10027610_034850 [Dactylosporangium cerinum]
MGDERVEGLDADRVGQPEGRGDPRHDERRLPHRRKVDALGAAGEVRRREVQHLHRESRLAHPAGAGDRHEPARARPDEGQQFGELAVAADEWCHRARRGVVGTAGRRQRDRGCGGPGG